MAAQFCSLCLKSKHPREVSEHTIVLVHHWLNFNYCWFQNKILLRFWLKTSLSSLHPLCSQWMSLSTILISSLHHIWLCFCSDVKHFLSSLHVHPPHSPSSNTVVFKVQFADQQHSHFLGTLLKHKIWGHTCLESAALSEEPGKQLILVNVENVSTLSQLPSQFTL